MHVSSLCTAPLVSPVALSPPHLVDGKAEEDEAAEGRVGTEVGLRRVEVVVAQVLRGRRDEGSDLVSRQRREGFKGWKRGGTSVGGVRPWAIWDVRGTSTEMTMMKKAHKAQATALYWRGMWSLIQPGPKWGL